MHRSVHLLSSLLLALGLTACGGGGSGSVGAGAITVGDPTCESHPGSGQTSMTQPAYEMAGAVWCLTNDARSQNNLPPLTWDDVVAEIAYQHSVYQREQGEISHDGPGGNDAGDRLTDGGVSWSAWGENVAVGQPTPTAVVNAWLGSSGHYANIMSTAVSHLGVGVEEGPGGPYDGPWWTQVFYSP